jgi:hypothetical protein
MLFSHCSLIQEGESILFYRFNRELNGYVIAGMIVSNNLAAKRSFVTLWKYFVSEVVTGDDIYCTVDLAENNNMFANYVHYHSTVDGLKIYTVDNSLKDQYSAFAKHTQRAG